jgi:hypothetical protein
VTLLKWRSTSVFTSTLTMTVTCFSEIFTVMYKTVSHHNQQEQNQFGSHSKNPKAKLLVTSASVLFAKYRMAQKSVNRRKK